MLHSAELGHKKGTLFASPGVVWKMIGRWCAATYIASFFFSTTVPPVL